jgi:hypothetical protein
MDIGVNLYQADWQPERFRAVIYSHPGRQRIRWWKATRSVAYDSTRGRQPSGTSEWDYTEQITAANGQLVSSCRALVDDVDMNTKYAQWGQLVEADQICVTMPDELPIGEHDIVQPLGNDFGDSRISRFAETVTRGGTLMPLSGTISSIGTAVTGVGTTFTMSVQVGDVVTAAGRSARVTAVTNDTHLTLDVAPNPAWTNLDYFKGYDPIIQGSVIRIDSIAAADGSIYPAASYMMGADGSSIQWVSGSTSPAPGAKYSITYWFAPRYYALANLGTTGPVTHGVSLPRRVVLRLYHVETIAR